MRAPQVSERIKEVPAQALRGVFAGIGQLLLITDKLRNKAGAGRQVPSARAPEPPETVTGTAASSHDVSASVQAQAQQVPEASDVQRAPEASDVQPVPEAQEAPEAQRTSRAKGVPDAQEAPEVQRARKAQAPREEGNLERETAEHPRTPRTPGTVKADEAPETRDFDKTGNVRLLSSAEGRARDAAKTGSSRAAGEAEAAAGAGEATAAAGAGEAEAPLPNYDELSVASLRARLRNLDITQVRQLAEYEKAHAARADVIAMFERRIAKLEAEATAAADARAEASTEAREEVGAEVRADVEAEAEAET